MAEYIDIGVNLTASSFRHDLGDVIRRAHEVGVTEMIVTGTDISHSVAAVELCVKHPDILYSTAGVHPHHADDYSDESVRRLTEISRNQCVVAIGECGLDYNRNYSSPDAQRKAFASQLRLACELGKPVFLHQRDAHQDFMSIFQEYAKDITGAVAHCFTGNRSQVDDYLDLGMYIGITGWVCDERRGSELQQAVPYIPLERILLETDAPYLLPRDLKQTAKDKRRNEPCFLPHICQTVAKYKGIDADKVAATSVDNAARLFSL